MPGSTIYREPRARARLGRVKRPRLSSQWRLVQWGEDGGCRGVEAPVAGDVTVLTEGCRLQQMEEHVKAHHECYL